MRADEDIDAAVLSSLTVHWQKVAMVAAKAMARLKVPITDDDTFDKVCGRIESLVNLGKVVARGNVSVPTQSEVRIKSGTA
jgi:Protein of unknown function